MSITLKKVKSNLERVLDKNLQDLVRGIRAHKNNEAKYISECLEEIKQELRQENVAVKANAISKLTYLQMLGYDISWAAFNIIEVMSSPKFTYKRIAYLAASQCFHKDLDVLMLSTNLLRKDLNSHNFYDCGLAITSLSCFMTPDLARDLGNDIITLMNSTKPYLRKKSVLLMYKVFLNHPDMLRSAFPRLREKLEDTDPGVQSAAVHVICELARRNPQNYLPLAPTFFKLMTSSVNNWVLIKIIKLFGALTPIEPRLGKKLLEPLTNLIHSTSAMSLLYECIQTVIAVLLSITSRKSDDMADSAPPEHASAIQLCVQKLRVLIEDSDQNLKYLGLLAMSKILEAHPKPVQAHKDLILSCLDDRDESIRLRALDLLHGMVSRKNLVEITRKLIVHAEKAEGSHYRDEIVAKVIDICSQSNYLYVTNFEWYISVLVELARLQGMKRGQAIAAQILDVAIRVSAVRPFAVQQMAIILQSSHIFYSQSSLQANGSCEVLYASAWICGEFAKHLPQPSETLDSLLTSRVSNLPPHIQAVFLQNAAKVYGYVLKQLMVGVSEDANDEEDDEDELQNQISELNNRVKGALASYFLQSSDLEVQERASCFQALIDYVDAAKQNGISRQLTVVADLVTLFDGDLNPVAPRAQRKVPVPEGLDLEKWINEPPPDIPSPVSSEIDSNTFGFGATSSNYNIDKTSNRSSPQIQLSPGEMKKRREQRLAEQNANPHYLKGTKKSTSPSLPRVQQLQGITRSLTVSSEPESSEGTLLRSSNSALGAGSMLDHANLDFSTPRSMKKKKGKKGSKGKQATAEIDDDDEDNFRSSVVVNTTFDMPEGASLSDSEQNHTTGRQGKSGIADDDIHKKLADITFDDSVSSRITNGRSVPTSASMQTMKEDAVKPLRKKTKSGKETKKKTSGKKSKKNKVLETEKEVDENLKTLQTNVVDDDLNFWLAPSESTSHSPTTLEEPKITDESNNINGKKTKSGSQKKSPRRVGKKSGKSLKKSTVKEEMSTVNVVREDLAAVLGPAPDRSEYEIDFDSGSATPRGVPDSVSADHLSAIALPEKYTLLAENAALRLGFRARPDDTNSKHVVVSVCLQNLTTLMQIKEFELAILDAAGGVLSLLRTKKVRLPSSIMPLQNGDGVFKILVGEGALSSGTVPRMRGTVSYVSKATNSTGTASQDQLEFRLQLPVSSFIQPEPYSTADSLQQLMTSGLLSERECSTASTKSSAALDQVAARIASEMHISIVERPNGSGSSKAVALHGRTINGDHLCVLLKQQHDSTPGLTVIIDARASQPAKTFLGVFVVELVNMISSC